MNKVPKAVQPKVKEKQQDIWMADTRENACEAFESCVEQFELKFPKAMECLVKDKAEMLAFYEFPAEHRPHIRITNPVELAFATIRLKTNQTKSCGSRKIRVAMTYKPAITAQKQWRRLRGFRKLADAIQGVKFKDGEPVRQDQKRDAA